MKQVNTNYLETLEKIDMLKECIEGIEKNIYDQIPQGVTDKFDQTKIPFINWVEEIEFNLLNYIYLEK
jgi:hypothetical protein